MTHLSPANSEGYPGDVLTQIKYSWTDDNQLLMNIRASSTQPTPVDVTTNCLMNLAGHVKFPIKITHRHSDLYNFIYTTLPHFLFMQRCFNFTSLFYND